MVVFVVAVDFREGHRKKVEGPRETAFEIFSTMERARQRSWMHLSLRQTRRNDWKLFVKRGEVGTYNRVENKHSAVGQRCSPKQTNWHPQHLKELYNVLQIPPLSTFFKILYLLGLLNLPIILNLNGLFLWKVMSCSSHLRLALSACDNVSKLFYRYTFCK